MRWIFYLEENVLVDLIKKYLGSLLIFFPLRYFFLKKKIVKLYINEKN